MDTLFDRIGPARLESLVENFYSRVFNSPVISHLFQNDKAEIMQKQLFFLTQFLGGPQLYNEHFGHPRMRMRHAPHKIDEAAKTEWLRCMYEAIQEMDLDQEVKDALYACFPPVAQHMVNS